MKNLLALIMIGFSVLHAQGVQFSSPISVTSGTTYSYIRPRVTLNAANNPVVLWCKTSTHEIYVSTFNGTSFNTPVQINPVGTHPFLATWYNADIKSSGDTVVAVFCTEMPEEHVYLVRSIDGGNTWSDTTRVDNLPAGGIAYFPSVAINENGHIAVSFMRHEAGWLNPRYVVTTSFDGGNSFLPDTNATAFATGDVCDCCPSEMIYEGNREVLIFRNNNANLREFYTSVSNDNGSSFNGMNIDNQGWIVAACPSSAPSALVNGDSLVAVFMTRATGPARVYISTSDINTLQNGFTQMVDTTSVSGTTQNYPSIAGKDSIMALVWGNLTGGESDIYFRYSHNGAADLIGDGVSITSTGIQQSPDIVFANGIFHIVYQNDSNQEVVYLKATMDEYISIEENAMPEYTLLIQNETLLLNFNEPIDSYAELFDCRGALLWSSAIHNESIVEVDLQSFAHGIYWLKLHGMSKPVKFYR